jgi:hypothetical protein
MLPRVYKCITRDRQPYVRRQLVAVRWVLVVVMNFKSYIINSTRADIRRLELSFPIFVYTSSLI